MPPLHLSDTTSVFSGTLFPCPGCSPSSKQPNVAIKFALNEDGLQELFREHRFYTQKLVSLQGLHIPRYYGMYANPHEGEEGQPLACMLLEYCGSCLSDPKRGPGSPKLSKTALLAAVTAIHDLGFVHGDITADNILLDNDGGLKVVDFTYNQREKCM
ncbi:hypothetical protein OF83DRAFT_1179265 [Amylostereum chailletii]|nr:hypothetical protein OF83DRAFT_1179265 [Amylostereum chailletii]